MHEYIKKCSEMKILALCSIKTQLWCFLKTKNSQKFLTWIWLNIFQLIMFKTWKKTQKRSKKDPQMKLPVHFTVLHTQKFCSNFIKFGQNCCFRRYFPPGNYEMSKYTWICIRIAQKNPDFNLWFICPLFSADPFMFVHMLISL